MNYPLISEYIEAIKSTEDNFKELINLRPVLGPDGQPVMTSGNFAVVFKMQDTETGKFYALKCFTKEQERRAEAYNLISNALKDVDSPYLVSFRYLDKELSVDTEQTAETEFPVLLMDWVEGIPLDIYISNIIGNQKKLEDLTYKFCKVSSWLLSQPFAHGNLQPDNILIKGNGSIVLIDYDNMFVPEMKGQNARKNGNPNYCHPHRISKDYDLNIDCFAITLIALSLKVITIEPCYMKWYGGNDHMLLSVSDYENFSVSPCVQSIKRLLSNTEIMGSFGMFMMALSDFNYKIDISNFDKVKNNWLESYNEDEWIAPYKDKTLLISNDLLNSYSLEDIEIGIVDSVYKEKVCRIIKDLYFKVNLKENVFYMNILWLLLNHDYGTWDDINLNIRESWLSSPKSYFFTIGGQVDSIESCKGEWIVWYNEHNYPYNKEDMNEYHYETNQMFSLDTVVNVSFEIFKRMRLISRFLHFGQNAIAVIENHHWLTETNHCGFQIKNDTDDINLPV